QIEIAQTMTGVVPGQPALPRRADIFNFEYANQKRAQLVRFGCDGLCSRQPFRIARKQLRVVMDHRGARSRRADNGVGLALFEDADKTLRYRSRLVEIACIESRLRATRLSLVKLHLS